MPFFVKLKRLLKLNIVLGIVFFEKSGLRPAVIPQFPSLALAPTEVADPWYRSSERLHRATTKNKIFVLWTLMVNSKFVLHAEYDTVYCFLLAHHILEY